MAVAPGPRTQEETPKTIHVLLRFFCTRISIEHYATPEIRDYCTAARQLLMRKLTLSLATQYPNNEELTSYVEAIEDTAELDERKVINHPVDTMKYETFVGYMNKICELTIKSYSSEWDYIIEILLTIRQMMVVCVNKGNTLQVINMFEWCMDFFGHQLTQHDMTLQQWIDEQGGWVALVNETNCRKGKKSGDEIQQEPHNNNNTSTQQP